MSLAGYTKLFSSIVTSTLWLENDHTRLVFVTMLALADKNGEVAASLPGLAHLAHVPVEACRSSIERLLSPDPDSRTQDFEGRRIVAVDGGWRLLNHSKYRAKMNADERREYLAEKQRQHRAKCQHGVNNRMSSYTPSTHAEADADKEKKKKGALRLNLTDEEFFSELKPLYPKIDLEAERRKMAAWFLTPKGRGRKLTRGFAVNWLNRVEVPMDTNGAPVIGHAVAMSINSVAQADSVLKEIEAEIARVTNAPGAKVQKWQPSPHMALTDEARQKIEALKARRETLRVQKMGMA